LTDTDNNFKPKTDAENIELAKKLVKIWDKKRTENYNDLDTSRMVLKKY
jgi:hypothetical protein